MKKQHKISAQDLVEINRFTIDELTEDEIFTFRAIFSDKQMDELDCEKKKKIAKKMIGNLVLEDNRSYCHPIAKVYQVEYGILTPSLLCYAIKTAQNTDLIARIRAGIQIDAALLITDDLLLHLRIVKG